MTGRKHILLITVAVMAVSALRVYAAGQSSVSFNVTADVFQQGHGPVTIEGGSFAVSYSVGQRALTGEVTASANFNTWLGFQAQIDSLIGSGTDSDSDGMDDDWEIACFGDLSHPADEDYDKDGLNNLLEYLAGTDPTNDLSVLQLESMALQGGTGELFIEWQSVSDRSYCILSTTNLFTPPALWDVVYSNLPGIGGMNQYTVTVDEASVRYYRIKVE